MTRLVVMFMMVASVAYGCAAPLSSLQKSELRGYQAKGLEVKEKNPTAGAVLGILPGGGSFYAREAGLGIVNLLFWPLSILWDPVSGYEGSQAINYYATKVTLDKKQKKEIGRIEDDLRTDKITKEEYLKKKHEVEDAYSPDFE